MELQDYPIEDIEAAIKRKKMTKASLAKKLGRSSTTVAKTINRNSAIISKRLNKEIVEELQPELDIIHQAFVNYEKAQNNTSLDQSPDLTQSRARLDS
jgi:lambda repressor-like predicted transcriptional regulator